jgi:hypothetical protein
MANNMWPEPAPHARSRRSVFVVALCLTVAAALPRLANLGELSFVDDEETSAFPARSLLERGEAVFPSGMEYRRALPQSWVNAASARLFGVDREFSYRLPAALLGTLTIPLLFVGGRRFFGDSTALVAAVLLSLSAWHLTTSRMNRMYGPLLFCFLLAAFAAWWWVETGRLRALVVAAFSYAGAVAFHAIGILAAALPLLVVIVPGWSRVRVWKLASAGMIAAVAGRLFQYRYVRTPYGLWDRVQGREGSAEVPGMGDLESLASTPWWFWALAGTGLLLGLLAATRSRTPDEGPGALLRSLASFGLAGLAGIAVFLGQLYGAALAAVLFLLLQQGDRRVLLRQLRVPAAAFVLAGLSWVVVSIGRLGLEEGLKSVVQIPFPYPFFLAQRLYGVLVLFGVLCVWLVLRPPHFEERGLRGSVGLVLATVAGLGLVAEWAPNRYLIAVYPFVLLPAAHAIVLGGEAVVRRLGRASSQPIGTTVTAVGIVLAASGLLGSHGIPQAVAVATQDHGVPEGLFSHALQLRPDHRGAGLFLREAYTDGDVIIAEDPLQIRWYSGRADYWLRSRDDARAFLHVAPDGTLRDNYVNSALVLDVDTLRALPGRTSGRVWLATSAETALQRAYFLDARQHAWLDSLEAFAEPAFTGSDGLTRVFCLQCERGAP